MTPDKARELLETPDSKDPADWDSVQASRRDVAMMEAADDMARTIANMRAEYAVSSWVQYPNDGNGGCVLMSVGIDGPWLDSHVDAEKHAEKVRRQHPDTRIIRRYVTKPELINEDQ